VNDAATGQPTPCRVRFTDAEGRYYAPFGRLTEFAICENKDVGGNLFYGEKKFAYIDGTCEIDLPSGSVRVEVTKGPEFYPIEQEINLVPGKLALRLTLERWSDIRQEGWYPGDVRAHYLTPHGAQLEGAAEDLAVVNLLVRVSRISERDDPWNEVSSELSGTNEGKSFTAIPNLLSFSGQQPALQTSDCLVVVNTHNYHPRLGALALLNCHRIVFPLRFGYQLLGEQDDWTFADWCDQCHRKGGLVVWSETDLSLSGRTYGEPLADAILGKVDAVEVTRFPWHQSPFAKSFDWYGLLDCGLRLPLAGASEKTSNFVPLGVVRTYARVDQGAKFNYGSWIEAILAGRTFVSNGPVLRLTVNGHGPGAHLVQDSTTTTVNVRAEARSLIPFQHLEIVANGVVVAATEACGSPRTASIEAEIPMPVSGWLAARCRGGHHFPGYFSGQWVYAHTSPVYVEVAGQPRPIDQDTLTRIATELDNSLKWVREEARCDEKQRERLANIFRSAKEELLKRSTV
jgi:hypothetical protein